MTPADRILGTQGKPLPRSTGALSSLFRQLVNSRNIDKSKWRDLMSKYVMRPISGVSKTPAAWNSEKRNKRAALAVQDMHWKTFIAGVEILNPKYAEFDIHITRNDGSTFHMIVPLKPLALGDFFRALVLDKRIDLAEWDANMREYIAGNSVNLPNNPKDRSTYRGNLDKALGNKNVTWNSLQRGLQAHKYIIFHYTLRCTWATGKKSENSIRLTAL